MRSAYLMMPATNMRTVAWTTGLPRREQKKMTEAEKMTVLPSSVCCVQIDRRLHAMRVLS